MPTLRTATADDFPRIVSHLDLVFGEAPSEEGRDEFRQWLEFDRVILAEDGPELVGTAATHSFRMHVPGGALVPLGGLTIVGVRPTHRRRGVLRDLMRRHLEDVRDRGEVAGGLYASESSIYGRFGYGMAVPSGELTLARAHGAFRSDIPQPSGSYRLLELEAAKDVIRFVFAAATTGVPGALVPREQDWTMRLSDFPGRRDGATPFRVVVYDRDGEPRGYARYRQKDGWGDGGPEGKVLVRELQARDGEAYAALWRFLLDIDLSVTVEAISRPVPEPLRLLLRDPRRLVEKFYDGMWIRPVDVAACLSGRRYRTEGCVVLEVRDPVFAPSTRYRLEGGPDGADCSVTDAAPDLTLGVEQLGSVLLGWQSLRRLAWLGLIDGEPGAVGRADDMFSWPVPPANHLHF